MPAALFAAQRASGNGASAVTVMSIGVVSSVETPGAVCTGVPIVGASLVHPATSAIATSATRLRSDHVSRASNRARTLAVPTPTR